MYAYHKAGTALFLAFSALSITGCGNTDSTLGTEASEVQPERVDPQALRAAVEDEQAKRFYEAIGWKAAWNNGRARELVAALDNAGAHALNRDDFLEESLPGEPAEREAALTRAALAYASALARGVTDPEKIRDVYTVARPDPDLVAGLSQAVAQDRVADWFQSLAPQTPEYQALSREFVRYAKQAQSGQEARIDSGDAIEAGDSDPRVPRIVEALAANGYLDARQLQQSNPNVYTKQIAAAVQRMQDDYGIKADGIVGSGTLEVLNAGAADRARQLAVNLERLRWLEREAPPTRIDVNTAAATLDYYRDGQLRDHRVVVVGEPGWETPLLGSPMFRLVANPTWTVPKSIEEDELAAKGPGYLRANNMVRKDGWIVQQPGPDNALGQVKFDLQNDQAIYLHDTPHKALFSQNERHRSHGCIRVADALGFANLIAGDQNVLPQFRQAMATGEETFVKFDEEIPVRLLYQTAFFRDGKVQFRNDAYGWDEDVARALGRQARERRTVEHKSGRDVGP